MGVLGVLLKDELSISINVISVVSIAMSGLAHVTKLSVTWKWNSSFVVGRLGILPKIHKVGKTLSIVLIMQKLIEPSYACIVECSVP
uniref:9,8K protein n=1 Tax=Garlic latent virus TaxID=12458 RepID=Q67548_9VIRU|nr:9,8K protein [Garlic latent virus]